MQTAIVNPDDSTVKPGPAAMSVILGGRAVRRYIVGPAKHFEPIGERGN